MTLRVLVCMLLLAPARAHGCQAPYSRPSLLDLAVSHAREAGAALLVPRQLADDLGRIRPDPPAAACSRPQLEAWLATRGAGLSRLPTGGLVVYVRSSDWARQLLERNAPLVERTDLARSGSDLVWCVVETGRLAVVEPTPVLVELTLGSRRVLGGPADELLARIGPPVGRPSPAGLVEEDGPPRLDGPPLQTWLESLDDLPESIPFVVDPDSEGMLDNLRIWNGGSIDTLLSVGVRVSRIPRRAPLLLVIEAWTPQRVGPATVIHDLRALALLDPNEWATLALELEHLCPPCVSHALRALLHGPLQTVSSDGRYLVFLGRAHTLRLWIDILRLADVPD